MPMPGGPVARGRPAHPASPVPPPPSALRRPAGHVPAAGAPRHPRLIGHDDDVVAHAGQLQRRDAPGIAAAQVEAVPQVHGAQAVDDAAHAPGPVGVAQAQALVLPDVVVIAQPPADRPLRDLDVRGQDAVVEDGVAQARAQGDDHLQAAAGDDAGAGDLGVVEDQGGQVQPLADGAGHIEAGPGLHELGQDPRAGAVARDVVGRGDDHAVADHAGHPHRHPVRRRQPARQGGDGLHERGRRQRVGGGGAPRAGDDGALDVEDGGLDPAAAAVDGQGGRTGHGTTLPGGGGGAPAGSGHDRMGP